MQHKRGITRFSKIMITIQFVLVVAVFCSVLFLVPYLDYPLDNSVLEQKDVGFKFRNANVILIDDNEDFSSATKISSDDVNMSKFLFKPGVYYWKAVGIFQSIPRKFSISSSVGLEVDEESSSLKNVGNSALNVSTENKYGISGHVVLGVDEEYPIDVEEEINYRGEQYED